MRQSPAAASFLLLSVLAPLCAPAVAQFGGPLLQGEVPSSSFATQQLGPQAAPAAASASVSTAAAAASAEAATSVLPPLAAEPVPTPALVPTAAALLPIVLPAPVLAAPVLVPPPQPLPAPLVQQTLPPAAAPAEVANSSFIRTAGTAFVDDSCREFHFTGFNSCVLDFNQCQKCISTAY